ncbi:TIGR02444 family protein [Halomonas sp. AOP43-A1-21]|uniref:TIGR02444 family protein n=1 Tax=Halomonas colorata TaxID=2742615 RepID=A0ABR9FWB6_9GAMM|nr:TIGR02444 family protein [Halomonas colorata]MBE0462919.1 TIGR02444 family protein [Halomonas colorata]
MLDSNRLRRLEQAPLWDFALAFYAEPGIESACLTLQDSLGVDVCEILLHSWLFVHGFEARPYALAVEREERNIWQREITQVLRHLRRTLKPQALQSSSIATLRQTIQQAELQAERENLQRWQTWAMQMFENNPHLTKRAENIQNVAQWLQDRLFFGELDKHCPSGQSARESVSQAWQTLAARLDRFE